MPTRKPSTKGRAPAAAAGPRRGATKAQAEPADAWAALQAELAPFHPDADPAAGAAALKAARDRADASRQQQAETALAAARAELQGTEWVRVHAVATVVAGGNADKAARIRRDLIDAARVRGLPVRSGEPPHEPVDVETAASIGPMFELLAVLWWGDADALLAQHMRSAVHLGGPARSALTAGSGATARVRQPKAPERHQSAVLAVLQELNYQPLALPPFKTGCASEARTHAWAALTKRGMGRATFDKAWQGLLAAGRIAHRTP